MSAQPEDANSDLKPTGVTAASEAWTLAFGALPVSEAGPLRDAAEIRFFANPDPRRFQKLCRIEDLDAFLSCDAARSPRVRLADSRREGAPGLPSSEYAKAPDGRIDILRVLALHDGGATLVLSQMHEVLPALQRFCRGLEHVFLHPVQCNVYLTPPNGQGFRVHYDTHDVLILQVDGEKRWRVWPNPAVPFANTRTPSKNVPIPESEPCHRLMRPGDVLYVPRGVLHDAASQGSHSSLHLTIGLLSSSWGEALQATLNILEREDVRLRHSFPSWRLMEGRVPDDLVEQAAVRLSALASTSAMELLSQSLLTRLAAEQMPMIARGLIAPTVSPSDHLTLSDTVHYFVGPRPDGTAELRWAGETIVLSAEEFGWLTRLTEGAAASELEGADALSFCQRLACRGLLVVRQKPPT